MTIAYMMNKMAPGIIRLSALRAVREGNLRRSN